MPIELKITAESPAELAFHVRSLNALFAPPMMVTADGDIVPATSYAGGLGGPGTVDVVVGLGGASGGGEAQRRTRGPSKTELAAGAIPGVKDKGDGVALKTTEHPSGAPVAEDADISPSALETVEVEVVGNDTLVVAEEPKTVSQNGVDVPALTYEDDIKPAILMISMKKGREGVFRVLAQFGAEKSAKEIAEDKWPALLEAVESELAAA